MDYFQEIKRAFEQYQLGHPERAESIIQKILKKNPKNIDVHMYLGETLHESGRLDEAIRCYQNVLEIDPEFVWGYFHTGLVLQEKGQVDEAISQYQRAIQIEQNLFEAYYNLGLLFSEKQQIEESIEYYEKALQINPELADAYYNIGNNYRISGQLEKAIINYQKALEINPNFTNAMNNLGIAFQDNGQINEAIFAFQRAVQINPDFLNAYENLGNILKDQGEYDKAIQYYQKAIQLDPSFAETFIGLGTVYREKQQFDEAIINYRKAIQLNPHCAEAYYNLGNAFSETGRYEEAIDCFQNSIIFKPAYSEAYNNMGIALHNKGQYNEALTSYKKAVQLNPSSPRPHENIAYNFLYTGKLIEGWEKYQWRLLSDDYLSRESAFPQSLWDGRLLKGMSLLVYAEQGVGDEIMFASCLPEVISQTDRCIIECDRRMTSLFTRSFPKAIVIQKIIPGNSYSSQLPYADMRIIMGSLPKYLRPAIFSFPQQQAYLIPDSLNTDTWRRRFKELGTGLKIGISWRGGSKLAIKLARSTVLSKWKELFSIPGIHFINLQYGDCSDELREAQETLGITIHDWQDANPLKDLDNFAAQIAALDLVISADNTTVHMAGALGVPVWVLLPFVCDWRWMRDFEDTPWYKSVRLIRQKSQGDWDEVFKRAASDLRHYLETGIMPNITNSYKSTLSTETANKPASPVFFHQTERSYRCAVITPVGPGHESLYKESLASVEKAFNEKPANCAEILPIRIDDLDGKIGRSKARNLGIKQAAEQNADWIFFLDADDLMSPSAFEYVSPYLDDYDGIWGSIWSIEQGEAAARERPKQLPFLYSIEDVLSCDPFFSLQMGHFIKTQAALATLFDEDIDTGEDFDYYLRVWEKYRCIKIPLPFFYNRRGLHSHGPRSATGYQWHQNVEKLINRYLFKHPLFSETRRVE